MSRTTDDDKSLVIAGLLCFLLTGFLCCRGESTSKPVSAVGSDFSYKV